MVALEKKWKMTANERFDNIDHWLEFDDSNSRSLCKLPGCRMLTHSFCSKCNIHLCFNRNRNCFRRYHSRIDQNTQFDDQPLDISKVTKHSPSTERREEAEGVKKMNLSRREILVGGSHKMRSDKKIIKKNKRLRREVSFKLSKNDQNSTSNTQVTATETARNHHENEQTAKGIRFLRHRAIN